MQIVAELVLNQIHERFVIRFFDHIVEWRDLDASPLHLKVEKLKLADVFLDQIRRVYERGISH